MQKTLYRSRSDRVFGGVAGGLADYLDQDPTLVRVIAVLLAVVTSGTAVIAYLVMWLIVPEEPAAHGSEPAPSYLEQWAGEKQQTETSPTAAPGQPPVQPASNVAQPTGVRGRPCDASSRRGRLWFGAILIAVGVFALVERFVPGVDLWSLWPVAVIAIGIGMLFGRKGA